MTGNAGDRKALNAGNCNNPRFRGNLGVGSANPNCDPYVCGSIQQAPTNNGGSGAIAGDPTAGGAAGAGGTGSSGSGGGTRIGVGLGPRFLRPLAAVDRATSRPRPPTSRRRRAEHGEAGAGRTGAAASVGGGSAIARKSDPQLYRGAKSPDLGAWPLIILVVVLVTPIVASVVFRRRRSSSF